MSITQTSQLIQLILNSVVTAVACIVLLNGAQQRQLALSDRLQQLQRHYLDALKKSAGVRNEFLVRCKHQLQQLQRRYQLTRYSLLLVHYALLFLVGSAFSLALRTLIGIDELITVALGLFVIGLSVLLLSLVLMLPDLHADDRTWRTWLLNWQPDRSRQPLPPPKALEVPLPQSKVG